MFDWNEDELADIIWGDANETGDHIVPYPKGSEETLVYAYGDLIKKQTSQEASTVVKSAEKKASEDKNDLLGRKLENGSCFNTNEDLSAPRLDMDSWPTDLSGQDSMGNKVPDDFPDVINLDSVKGPLHTDTGLLGNDYEDKENGSFLDYSWANIGNFDDLDKIFRNDDSLLGNEMIGDADELWSSYADVIASPTQSYSVAVGSPSADIKGSKTTSGQFEVEAEFKPFKSQPLVPDHDKRNEASGRRSKPFEVKTEDSTENTAETASKSQLTNERCGIRRHLSDKVIRERKLLKCRKKAEEKSKAKSLPNRYGSWSTTSNQIQQFGNLKMHVSTKSVPQTFPSLVISPRRQLGGPESLRYLHTSNPFMHTAYGYPTHNFPVVPMLPLTLSERERSQPVMASYNYSPDSPKLASPSKKLPDVPSRSLTMTPQEKIEKLRRRQQMQAMLAIQRQQQQLRHQVTSTDDSVNHKCSLENQENDALPSNIEVDENKVKVPSLEFNMPTEQDDSNKFSTLNDEYALEETIFNQLQDVMGKLDICTRLCIRDSLFRLARSAMQRQNMCDTGSTNKSSRDEDEVLGSEETNSNDRSLSLPETEKDTNPIDRTVAHLLFHRSTEPCGRPSKDGIPKSAISCNPQKLPVQAKMEDGLSPLAECSESLTDKQSDSYQECQVQLPCISVDPQHENQLQNNP